MKEYDISEVAYKNGYSAGFGDGLAAAGIAPIQWVDASKVPFEPQPLTDYALIFKRQSDIAMIWTSGLIFALGLNPDDVLFWCPVNIPDPPEAEIAGGDVK